MALMILNAGRYEARTDWEDDAYSLSIKHNDKTIAKYYDGGQPEDNSFGRDYAWIPGELRRAYLLGIEDGKQQAYKTCEAILDKK